MHVNKKWWRFLQDSDADRHKTNRKIYTWCSGLHPREGVCVKYPYVTQSICFVPTPMNYNFSTHNIGGVKESVWRQNVEVTDLVIVSEIENVEVPNFVIISEIEWNKIDVLYLGDGPAETVLTGTQIHSIRSKKWMSLYMTPWGPLPPITNIRDPRMWAVWPYLGPGICPEHFMECHWSWSKFRSQVSSE